MKFLFLVLLLNLAYAQTDPKAINTPEEVQGQVKKEQEQQEAPQETIENPFEIGPYQGNEYIYFDKLRQEKEEKKLEEKGLI